MTSAGPLGAQARRVFDAIGAFVTWSTSDVVMARIDDLLACDFLF